MEIIKRTGDKTIQRVITTEQIIDIAELEARRDTIQNMLNIDAQTAVERDFVIAELDKTKLSDEQKQRALQSFVFSGTGATKSMLNDIQAQIDSLKALPVEAAVDIANVVIDGNIV